MKRFTLGLITSSWLIPGCFSPDDMGMESALADETPAVASSGAEDGESGDVEDDEDGSTGGFDDEPGGESSGGENEDPIDEGTTGGLDEDPEGSSSSGGDGEGTTGEACELGTDTDCLACGDSCSDEGTCTPEGCLEPITLGHAEAFDNLGGLDGFLWGFPVELDAPATLTHLAFIANGAGGDVQLSLYSDAGGSPSTRIVTAPAVLSYSPGVHESPVPEQGLAAGTYWIMATATNPTRIAVDLNGGAVNFGWIPDRTS